MIMMRSLIAGAAALALAAPTLAAEANI